MRARADLLQRAKSVKPTSYIEELLGDEGKGSILYLLKVCAQDADPAPAEAPRIHRTPRICLHLRVYRICLHLRVYLFWPHSGRAMSSSTTSGVSNRLFLLPHLPETRLHPLQSKGLATGITASWMGYYDYTLVLVDVSLTVTGLEVWAASYLCVLRMDRMLCVVFRSLPFGEL